MTPTDSANLEPNLWESFLFSRLLESNNQMNVSLLLPFIVKNVANIEIINRCVRHFATI